MFPFWAYEVNSYSCFQGSFWESFLFEFIFQARCDQKYPRSPHFYPLSFPLSLLLVSFGRGLFGRLKCPWSYITFAWSGFSPYFLQPFHYVLVFTIGERTGPGSILQIWLMGSTKISRSYKLKNVQLLPLLQWSSFPITLEGCAWTHLLGYAQEAPFPLFCWVFLGWCVERILLWMRRNKENSLIIKLV